MHKGLMIVVELKIGVKLSEWGACTPFRHVPYSDNCTPILGSTTIIPLRDASFCSKNFLLVPESITKVLLTVYYKRISGSSLNSSLNKHFSLYSQMVAIRKYSQ